MAVVVPAFSQQSPDKTPSSAALDVPVRVVIEGTARPDLTDVDLTLLPVPRRSSYPGRVRGKLRPDGSFVLPGFEPGDYTLDVAGIPRGFFVKAVRWGTEEVFGKVFAVSNPHPRTLEVVLSPGAGQVSGVVLDHNDQPYDSADIILLPEQYLANCERWSPRGDSDSAGRFLVADVRPGRYRALAIDYLPVDAFDQPGFFDKYKDRFESLEVKPSGHVSLRLKVVETGDGE